MEKDWSAVFEHHKEQMYSVLVDFPYPDYDALPEHVKHAIIEIGAEMFARNEPDAWQSVPYHYFTDRRMDVCELFPRSLQGVGEYLKLWIKVYIWALDNPENPLYEHAAEHMAEMWTTGKSQYVSATLNPPEPRKGYQFHKARDWVLEEWGDRSRNKLWLIGGGVHEPEIIAKFSDDSLDPNLALDIVLGT